MTSPQLLCSNFWIYFKGKADYPTDDWSCKWIVEESFSVRERKKGKRETLLGDLGQWDWKRRRQKTGGEGEVSKNSNTEDAERQKTVILCVWEYFIFAREVKSVDRFILTPLHDIHYTSWFFEFLCKLPQVNNNAANLAFSTVWPVPPPGFPLQCWGRSRVP